MKSQPPGPPFSGKRSPLNTKDGFYEGRFYVLRVVDLMKTAKVNAYIMFTFDKIELLSIHAT